MTARYAAFARRRGMFGKLRKAGVDIARVLRTGGLAGAQFGQGVLGVADYSLLQIRRCAAGMIGGAACGKDPNMVLIAAEARMGASADPAFSAHADTVVQWATGVWDNLLPIALLQRSLTNAKMALARARRQWAVVKGPAAALVATLARIGWTVIDATTAYDDLATEVSFILDSPAMVKRKVHESVRRWRWRLAGLLGGVGENWQREGPMWEPVAAMINRGKWYDPEGGGKEGGRQEEV